MFTSQDLELLAFKGITEAQIAEQLTQFEDGFPFLNLFATASIANGILCPDAQQQSKYLQAWDTYLHENHTIVKFVPASGAASRMFKDLFEFLGASYDAPVTPFEQFFFNNITHFAFYQSLNAV